MNEIQEKIKQIKLLQQEYKTTESKDELLFNNINDKIITFMLEDLPKELNFSWYLYEKVNDEYVWQIMLKKFMKLITNRKE